MGLIMDMVTDMVTDTNMRINLFNFTVVVAIIVGFCPFADCNAKERNTDPLYLQIYGGGNKSANENMPWTEFTAHPLAYGAFVGLGKEFSPLTGWRFTLGYNKNKSRNVPECENPDTYSWNDVELFGDFTLDLTDLFRKKASEQKANVADSGMRVYQQEKDRWNVKAFVGIGAMANSKYPQDKPLSYTASYNDKGHLSAGTRVGITATYLVNSNVRLGAELSHTIATDNFNGVTENSSPIDMRTNLSVGAAFLLTKQQHTKKIFTPAVAIYKHKLPESPELSTIAPDKEYEKIRMLKGVSYIDFPVSETIIYPKYRKNPEELQRIRASVDSAMFDPSIEVLSISLHGYASPESPYNNNVRLATGRTAALVNFLKDEYKFNDDIFMTDSTPEDWGNLRAFVEVCDNLKEDRTLFKAERGRRIKKVDKSVIEHKDELLRVIDMEMSPDPKEEVLKKVGGGKPYKWLLEHIYPGLRHTDYIIEYKVKGYSTKDAKLLIYTHPEALSLEEMYNVAIGHPAKSDERYEAFIIAVNQYPNDKTANYNAAVACIETKRILDAKKYLSKSGESDETDYLKKVIMAMEGNAEWEIVNGKVIIK